MSYGDVRRACLSRSARRGVAIAEGAKPCRGISPIRSLEVSRAPSRASTREKCSAWLALAARRALPGAPSVDAHARASPLAGAMGGKPPDPYEVLGLVQADAPSASDVRKAYHRLARVHHPDKARTPEEKDAAETRFKEIGAAYEILSDPEKREKYDRDGFDDHEWMTPAEAEEEERHARRMYCAAMGIPETVVREVWCHLEELYAGCVRREGVVIHVVAVDSGVPEKESKVFSVRVRPGTRDGREVRFGCLGTNALQSVAFVIRERPHPLFTRAPEPSPDVLFWCALTPAQHEKGAVIGIPTLSGRELRLSVKPNSAVASTRGVKVVAGEGFPRTDDPGARGDMRVHFRVMTPVEAWLRKGNRMWWVKALACVVGGYGALVASLRALLWALDLEWEEEVPDSLLLGEFPGLYGRIEGEMFYPRFRIPPELVKEWAGTGLGFAAVKLGMSVTRPNGF